MLKKNFRRIHNEGVDDKTEDSEHKYICEHCGQAFIALITLEKHIQSKHMEQIRVKCKICNASLSQFSLYAHMQNIHTSKPQKCPHCDKISPNKAALVRSMFIIFILSIIFQLIFHFTILSRFHFRRII